MKKGLPSKVKKSQALNKPSQLTDKIEHISSSLYRDLINISFSAIFFTIPDGTILEANRAASEMFGYSEDEFRQIGRQGIIEHADPGIDKLLTERKEHGRIKGERIGLKKNGERFPVEFSSSVFLDDAGKEYTCTIMNDISERKKADREMNLIVNNTDEAFILLNKELRVLSFNRQFNKLYLEFFGCNIVKGASILDYVQPERKEIVHEIYKRVLTGISEESELVFSHPGKTKKIFSIRFHPAKDEQDEIMGVFVTALDITSQKELENKRLELNSQLKQRTAFFESIFQYLPIGIAVNKIDDGKTTILNKQFSHIYGWPEEDFLDVKSFFRKVYPEETYRNKIVGQIMADMESKDMEKMQWDNISITTQTGEKRIINAKNIPLYDQNLMISTVLDVTRESQQAEGIKRAKTNQEALINGTKDLIWSVDRDLCIITANNAYREMMNMALSHPVNEGDSVMVEAFGEEMLIKWKNYYTRALLGESFTIKEQVYNSLKQAMQYSLISFNPMYKEEGKLFGIACYSKDITEETLSMQALESTKNKLSKVMNFSLDIICALTTDGTFIQVSQASEAIWGYTPDELMGRKYTDFIYPEDLPKTVNQIDHLLKGNNLAHIKNRYVHKNGTIVPMEWSARWDSKEQIRYSVGRDTTEKLKAEQALIISEQKYKNLFENNPSPMIIWDFETKQILECNEETLLKYGYTKAECLNLTIKDICSEEDISLFEEDTSNESVYGSIHRKTCRHKKKNGELMIMDLKGHLINYHNRRASLVILNDITEKVLAEEQLRQSEAFLAEAQRIAKMGSWNFDYRSDKLTWSDELYNVSGTDKNTFLETFKSFVELVDEEDREYVLTTHSHTQQTGKSFHIEYRITIPTGEKRIIEEFGYAEKDKEGNIIRMFGTAQNITERKKTEQKIIETNQRYEYVTKATFDAIWDWNIRTGKVIWGENYSRIFGYMDDEHLSDRENVIKRLHPDEKATLLASAETVLKSNTINWEQKHRFLKVDGSYSFVSNNALVIRDQTGAPIRVIGAMKDITKQKEEEQFLKLLESVITNTQDAVLITEVEPRDKSSQGIVYVNEAFTRMTGYTAEEVIGKSPKILQGPKSNRKELAKLNEALRKCEPCEITTINYRKNGEEIWVNLSVSPVANETGSCTHWIAIEKDITSYKVEELQKDLLSGISQLFNAPIELKTILGKVLEKMSLFAAFDASEAWITSTDQNRINLIAKYAKTEKSTIFFTENKEYWSLTKGEGLVGLAWETGDVHFWKSIDKVQEFQRRNLAQKAGFQSALSIPLVYNQENLGVLMFWISDESIPNQKLNLLFDGLGSHISAEIKRKQLEVELSRVFDFAPDVICISGTDGYFKKINPALCETLGYTEKEILSTPIIELLHPDDRNMELYEKKNLLGGKPTFHYENRYLTKSGKYIWISWTATPLLEEGLIFAVGKNVTERKQLEELLDKANNLAQIGGWELDVLQKKLFWSKITRKIHEVGPDFVPDVENGIHFYKGKKYQQWVTLAFKKAIEKGTPFDLELQIITALGNEKWVRLIGEAEFINDKCIRLYGSFQDINTQKKSELALTETLKEKDTILESIGDAFFAVNKNLKITYWNRMAEMVFGKSWDEVVGHNLWDVYKGASDTSFYSHYERALTENKIEHFEAFYEPLDAWHEVSIYPSNSGLSVYLRDVTFRIKAEKEIQASHERYNLAAKATSDIIWDWDLLKDKIIRSGDNIEKLLGYKQEVSQSVHFNWLDMVHPDDVGRVIEKFDHILQDPEKYFLDDDYRFRKADGEYAYLYDKGYIIRDDTGKAIRIIGATQDVTKLRENELQLKKRADELAISNLELEQFAFVASHDLQEPLRMITSFLSQLDKKYNDVLDEKAKKYIYFAVDGAKRMRQIILDLLEFSRVGRMENAMEELDLQKLLGEIEILLQKKIKEKNAEILIDPLPVIHSYRAPIRQVFQNLISNALKYSKENTDTRIHISVNENPNHWLFSVTDNGIGIHKDYFDKVFILFQRLHNKNEYSGTGIGLAVSKKIVENLGGKIWVESEEGKGSTFYFTLPK